MGSLPWLATASVCGVPVGRTGSILDTSNALAPVQTMTNAQGEDTGSVLHASLTQPLTPTVPGESSPPPVAVMSIFGWGRFNYSPFGVLLILVLLHYFNRGVTALLMKMVPGNSQEVVERASMTFIKGLIELVCLFLTAHVWAACILGRFQDFQPHLVLMAVYIFYISLAYDLIYTKGMSSMTFYHHVITLSLAGISVQVFQQLDLASGEFPLSGASSSLMMTDTILAHFTFSLHLLGKDLSSSVMLGAAIVISSHMLAIHALVIVTSILDIHGGFSQPIAYVVPSAVLACQLFFVYDDDHWTCVRPMWRLGLRACNEAPRAQLKQ
jgi:hypothetical protein